MEWAPKIQDHQINTTVYKNNDAYKCKTTHTENWNKKSPSLFLTYHQLNC